MYPETFSQYNEEQAILAHFRETKGRFLDIGAWDPEVFSNTRALFKRGWSGVLIEPSPIPLLSLLKVYGDEPRVELVQAAVALTQAPIRMWMSGDSVSTSDAASHDKWKDAAKFIGQLTVLTITWEQINLWFGGFQFINIDAEGTSVDLFRAMLASGQEPPCCCVEHDGRMNELCELATSRGYRLLYSNGTNAVFGK